MCQWSLVQEGGGGGSVMQKWWKFYRGLVSNAVPHKGEQRLQQGGCMGR